MALYRAGDHVTFTIMTFGIKEAKGQILRVRKNVDNGDKYNSYDVETIGVIPVRKYVIQDKHIHPFKVDAIPGIEGQRFNLELKEAMFGNAGNIINDPNPIAGVKDLKQEREEAKRKALLEQMEKLKMLAEQKPKPKPINKGIWGRIEGANYIPHVNPFDDEDKPQAVPAPPNPVVNLEDYKTPKGVLPEYVLTINNHIIPVYDYDKARPEYGITSAQYAAVDHKAKYYYIFKTKEGNILSPSFDAISKEIRFRCSITGRFFVNQHQRMGIHDMPERLRDAADQLWIELNNFKLNAKKPIAQNPYKPKKKLRRKYEEMPKIKDAKHYDTKDYIA